MRREVSLECGALVSVTGVVVGKTSTTRKKFEIFPTSSVSHHWSLVVGRGFLLRLLLLDEQIPIEVGRLLFVALCNCL